MFEILHSLGLSNFMSTPISGTDLVLIGFAYVDDSDLFAFSTSADRDSTATKMQKIIDSWQQSAKVTGGAIAPEKCWWYMLDFEWDNNCDWQYVKLDSPHQYTMFVNDSNDNRRALQYVDPFTAKEMLGVHLSPDGSSDEQVRQLKNKAIKAADIIRTTNVYPSEAWIALTTMAQKSLEYCLPATTLSENNCKEVMRPLLTSFLPKAKINRNIKQDVLYSDYQSQGLGLKSLYWSQGIYHVVEIIEHIWKRSTTGHFMQMSMEYLRLQIGTNDSFFQLNIKKFQALIDSNTWLTNTWEFMSKFNITTEINPTTIPLQRENDIPIMSAILNKNILNVKELQIVNKCRIYLKAFLLSDITSGNGKTISHNAWNGCNNNTSPQHSPHKWPQISCPSKNMWKVWRSALHQVFCRQSKQKLDTPLSKWYINPSG